MSFFSLDHLIALLHTYGYTVLGVVVGLESFGLPVPGESLLIAAAIYAGTTQQMSIGLVLFATALGAILGQAGGYWIGRGVGYRLLHRYGRHIGLTPRRIAFGRVLFRRHGVKVVIASRFVVVLRTLAAPLAGANRMPWVRFMAGNVVGSVVWAVLYGYGAYALGHEATRLAGPVAIAAGVAVLIVIVAAGLYARHREHRLLGQPLRAQRAGK